MIEESDLTPSLLQVAGLGAIRPRADNETLEGRLANRRVEVRVVALSKSRLDRFESRDWTEKKSSH
jgi:hypothetical protein